MVIEFTHAARRVARRRQKQTESSIAVPALPPLLSALIPDLIRLERHRPHGMKVLQEYLSQILDTE
jgi:hypothetical protein